MSVSRIPALLLIVLGACVTLGASQFRESTSHLNPPAVTANGNGQVHVEMSLYCELTYQSTASVIGIGETYQGAYNDAVAQLSGVTLECPDDPIYIVWQTY
jgi:hypothetical protein